MFLLILARRLVEIVGLAAEFLLAAALCLAFAAASVGAEPAPPDVLYRLERAEWQLAQTQAELETLRQRDAQRQAWERSIAHRLPAVEEGAPHGDRLFIPASERSVHDQLAAEPPMGLESQVEQLGASVEQLGAGMEEMKEGVEELGKALRVTTLREYSKIALFGELRGETLWSDARPIIPGAPLLLSPGSLAGFDQDSFDVSGKPTLLGAGIQGPDVGCYQTGGMLLFALFSETIVQDIYGLLPLLAYGEIKNDDCRFAAGLQFDVFNPVNPTMVNFNTVWASGNTGAYRGQVRVEKYYYPSCESQLTLQGAIGEALPTTIVNRRVLGPVLSEDNGIPNFEGRIALGLGPLVGEGADARRPIEVGVSGLVGEIRSTLLPATRVVADVWGVGVDCRWEVTDRFGFQGELFRGETLGTYLGSVGQTVNTLTLEGIQSHGGFGEVYAYLCPCVHVHFGYGMDDPKNSDLAPAQIEYNETLYGTVFWEVTESLRLGLEISRRETDYLLLPDNDGILVHTQVQWSF